MASTKKNPNNNGQRHVPSETRERPADARVLTPTRDADDSTRSFDAKLGITNGLLFPEFIKESRATSPDDSFRLSDLIAARKKRKAEEFLQLVQPAQHPRSDTSPPASPAAVASETTTEAPLSANSPRFTMTDLAETTGASSKHNSTLEESHISVADADDSPAIFRPSSTIDGSPSETRRNVTKPEVASRTITKTRSKYPVDRHLSSSEPLVGVSAPKITLTDAAPVSLHRTPSLTPPPLDSTCSPTDILRCDNVQSLPESVSNRIGEPEIAPSLPSSGTSLYDQAREAITSLICEITIGDDELHGIYTFQNAAFTGAAMINFYTSIGSVMWMYVQEESVLKQYQDIANWTECPLRARQCILDSLAQLEKIETVIPELTAEDMDQTDITTGPVVKRLADETQKAVNQLFFGDYEIDETHDQFLADIRTLLKARIGFTLKVELVGMAMVLWPSEKFESRSVALGEFVASHAMHLEKLRSCPANTS